MTLGEAGKKPGSTVGMTYWLISGGPGSDGAPGGVLTLDLDGLGRTLPVFSFREEAELFLALGDLAGGWRAGERGVGDLLALFLGDGADLKSVALDPLPAMLRDGTAGLVGLSVGRFVERFLGQGDPDAAPDVTD